MNVVAMECYYWSQLVDAEGKPARGYRKRMHEMWKAKGLFSVSEQRLCDQVRAIMRKGWLSGVELEFIRREALGADDVGEGNDGASGDGSYLSGSTCASDDNLIRGLNSEVTCNFEDVPDELRDEAFQLWQLWQELKSNDRQYKFNFRKVCRKRLYDEVGKVNEVVKYFKVNGISEVNWLIKAVSVRVANNLGLKETRLVNGGKVPWWRRRLEGDVKVLRHNISWLECKIAGQLRKTIKYRLLERKYNIKRKGIKVVVEELKQRLRAKSEKIKRYDQRVKQYYQNRLFVTNQKRFYQQLESGYGGEKVVPDANESVLFWRSVWGCEKIHNNAAKWLIDIKENLVREVQDDLKISVDMVSRQCKKVANWKSPGLDGVQGFWIKHLSSLHKDIAIQFDKLVSGVEDIPQWLTRGKSVLCLKDPSRGNAVDNYRPISCLPIMWKILTGIIADSLYEHLDSSDVLPVEQKGCRRNTREQRISC
jgi:hypothetical protein